MKLRLGRLALNWPAENVFVRLPIDACASRMQPYLANVAYVAQPSTPGARESKPFQDDLGCHINEREDGFQVLCCALELLPAELKVLIHLVLTSPRVVLAEGGGVGELIGVVDVGVEVVRRLYPLLDAVGIALLHRLLQQLVHLEEGVLRAAQAEGLAHGVRIPRTLLPSGHFFPVVQEIDNVLIAHAQALQVVRVLRLGARGQRGA
mmetsp:Transcript_6601/g.19607  ORF Transcript_6601/g.19607 Transcript_6601/m.19607 type:complete len:207 (-) Transcript_6601:141-761(-)